MTIHAQYLLKRSIACSVQAVFVLEPFETLQAMADLFRGQVTIVGNAIVEAALDEASRRTDAHFPVQPPEEIIPTLTARATAYGEAFRIEVVNGEV